MVAHAADFEEPAEEDPQIVALERDWGAFILRSRSAGSLPEEEEGEVRTKLEQERDTLRARARQLGLTETQRFALVDRVSKRLKSGSSGR